MAYGLYQVRGPQFFLWGEQLLIESSFGANKPHIFDMNLLQNLPNV